MDELPIPWLNYGLRLAVIHGNTATIDDAIAQGAMVDAIGKNGHTALILAARYGRKDIARHLIALGATPNESVWREALDMRHYPILDLLLELGCSLEGYLSRSLSCDVKWARSRSCPPLNPFDWHRDDTADFLNVILAAFGPTPYLHILRHAVVQKRGLLTSCVLDSGLLCASYMGKTDVVQPLLELGADVNATTPSGQTALHFACTRYLPIVQTLLQHGADINRRGQDGATPLLAALLHRRRLIARFLLNNGADIRPKLNYGYDAESIATARHMDRVLLEIQKRKTL